MPPNCTRAIRIPPRWKDSTTLPGMAKHMRAASLLKAVVGDYGLAQSNPAIVGWHAGVMIYIKPAVSQRSRGFFQEQAVLEGPAAQANIADAALLPQTVTGLDNDRGNGVMKTGR